jgi:hypothetical protein
MAARAPATAGACWRPVAVISLIYDDITFQQVGGTTVGRRAAEGRALVYVVLELLCLLLVLWCQRASHGRSAGSLPRPG